MDRLYLRSVDFYQLEITYLPEQPETPTLYELFVNEDLTDGDHRVKGKKISYRILEQQDDFIVGIVETNRNESIPPLKEGETGAVRAMDLGEGDGLVYGNVFYYEVRRNLLLYEVNKNGSVFSHFLDFIYRKLPQFRKRYSIRYNPILTANQNEILARMRHKTKIEVQIAHPVRIADDIEARQASMFHVFSRGSKLDTSKVKVEFSVDARNNDSLNNREADDTIAEILEYSDQMGVELEHLKISGYDDGVDNKMKTIDMVADRLKGVIELREPRLLENLLEQQRTGQIKELYARNLDQLLAIFGG